MTLGSRLEEGSSAETLYTTKILRLSNPADTAFFQHLRADEPRLQLFDAIAGQLRELVKSLQPQRRMSSAEIDEAVTAHLGGVRPADYGAWVYYPWSHRLVHLLDEKEFAFLRTNRNCHKITSSEQAALAGKKVGIIGLSVGQSIAMTLAMERSFGELRLADFDLLELTNLNRIRTGVHNLGVSKAVLVAREIAEIDPFLKTVCFLDGITPENVDAFFLDGGKLDIVVDECDGLDVKVLCRQKAKASGVPVLMDASDRGTLDVERFDLEPERPLLHGFLAGLDVLLIAATA
jgi:molybdopterin/thiamine biosynthesis adenylyltransferase